MPKSFNYIFIDESGKPEVYSVKGVNLVENGKATKFLVLAAVRCDKIGSTLFLTKNRRIN